MSSASIRDILDEEDIHQIRLLLEPYQSDITEILSVDAENEIRFQDFIQSIIFSWRSITCRSNEVTPSGYAQASNE